MPSATPLESIAAAADGIGSRSARQLDTLWRWATTGQGGVAGPDWFLLVSGEAHPLGNVAIVSAPADREVTAHALRPLLDIELPSAALYPNGVSDAVVEMLAALGFDEHGSMPAMAVDIAGMAPSSLPDGCTLERIDAGESAGEWTDVLATGYEVPRGLARMLSPEALGADMAAGAALQFFAVRHAGRLVATSMLFLADGMAGIYCVATLPEARNKGLGAHLTAAPLRLAQALGYGVGVLQSSEAGYTVYRGLGFQDVAAIPMFIRMPGSRDEGS